MTGRFPGNYRFFLEELKNRTPGLFLDYLDPAIEAPGHVSALFIEGKDCPSEQRTPEMLAALAVSDTLIDRLHDAVV